MYKQEMSLKKFPFEKDCGSRITVSDNLTLEKILHITYFWVYRCNQEFVCHNWEFVQGLQWTDITTPEKFVTTFCKPMKTMSSVARVLQLKQTKASFGKENITRADGWMESECLGAQSGTQRSVFFTTVENRTADTLVIKQHIIPGSTIISDCWKAYNSLDKEGFTHLTVNHSVKNRSV